MADETRLQNSMMAASVESGKAMGSATKDGKKDGESELYKLNQIWYRLPPTLSLVAQRKFTRCQFQQTSYAPPLAGVTMSTIFNTGEFFVSGPTSFLVIQAGIDLSDPFLVATMAGLAGTADQIALTQSTMHAYLGQGGILNIFDEISFISASGTEVDRQQNKGLQSAHVKRNRASLNWYNSVGEIGGYPGGSYQDCYNGKGYPGAVTAGGGAVWSPNPLITRAAKSTDYSMLSLNTLQTGDTVANSNLRTYFDTTHPQGVDSHVGSVDVSFNSTVNPTYNPTPGGALYFIVPLSDVLGMFSPYMNALIPPAALAGGRLEFRFKDMREALTMTGITAIQAPGGIANSVSANGNTFATATAILSAMRIFNVWLDLDSFQMGEGCLQRLNEASVTSEGLSVMFDTWDHTPTLVNAGNLQVEAQVSQARSRISRSFCVVRDQGMQNNPFVNSLASEAAINRTVGYQKNYSPAGGVQQMVNQYQAQLGSMYFPQQPLNTVEEYLMNSYYVWCKAWQNPEDVSAVSLGDFMGANGFGLWNGAAPVAPSQATSTGNAQVGAYISNQANGNTLAMAFRMSTTVPPPWAINWGSATYGFLGERSQLLQLSGLPISNARLLRHRFTFNYNTASTQGRIIDVFTEFTKVMKVFLGGRIVMRE